jgi:hypothetical protein
MPIRAIYIGPPVSNAYSHINFGCTGYAFHMEDDTWEFRPDGVSSLLGHIVKRSELKMDGDA